MNYLIPENLDIDELLKNYPPEKIEGFRFNKDHLIYILSLIFHIPISNPKVNIVDGFVPIKGKYLIRKIRAYHNYIDYLLKTGVWETDGHYRPGKKCIGYAYTEKYLTRPVEIIIGEKKSLFKPFEENEEDKETFGHLVAGLNLNLKILYQPALDYINANFPVDRSPRLVGVTGLRTNQIRYSRALNAINRINDSHFPWKVDTSIRRFYSPITSMPKEVRKFIYYENDQLAMYDMKNSQPFILLVILNKAFWENGVIGYSTISEILNFNKSEYLSNNYLIKFKSNNKTIMVDSLDNDELKAEIDHYAKLASEGRLYQELEEKQIKYVGGKLMTGSEFKQDFLMGLFSDNRHCSLSEALAKYIFKNEFPLIYRFIASLKRQEKRWFARLLQSIESYLFLIKIGKRLVDDGYKVQTIHDCIVTKAKHKETVLKIMDEEVYKAIGYHPKFDFETWLDPKEYITEDTNSHTNDI